MNIVFIQPRSFHCWEALNIGYLIASLKQYSTANIDFFSGFYDTDQDIIQACSRADMVGISATSPQMRHALSLADSIKRINPRAVIIFGGMHASALPEETLKHPCVDAVITGEGEQAIVEVAAHPELYRNTKKILHKEYIADLDTVPFPDRRAIKQERNIQQAYQDNGIRIGSIFSSRGCPFSCRFCASSAVWEKTIRYRSAENILEEYERLTCDFTIDFVKFSDDTFTIKKDLVSNFCELKIKSGNNVPWGCNVRADAISNDLLKLMRAAGCAEVWIGVESGSPRILKDMCKGITVPNIKRIFKATKELGFYRRAYMLLGMPNESMDDIRASEELIDEINPDAVGFTILAPYPGSSFYNHHIHRDVDWSQVDEYGNMMTSTKHLSNAMLRSEQKRLVNKYRNKTVFRQKLAHV
ncbi:MAG: radical SAM protein [Elusimicrobia bacterium]|nr:radical SAM protein [Elusimicrobiota bacterium]